MAQADLISMDAVEERLAETVWEESGGAVIRSSAELQLHAGVLPFSRQHARRDSEARGVRRAFEPYA